MTHYVHCAKLNKKLPGLENAPLPGAVGEKLYQQISHEAWQLWLSHQTMLINEYRLSLIDKKARAFLLEEMEKFLFGDGSEKPPGFNLPDSSSSS